MNVLQLIDSLETGGAERIAVNFANALASNEIGSCLVVTRQEGLLKAALNDNVNYLFLKRERTLDFKAIKSFNAFVKKNDIRIVHAHASSYFFAALAKIFGGKFNLIWHDHNGNRPKIKGIQKTVLKLSSYLFSGVITVNDTLNKWAKNNLACKKIATLNNFPAKSEGLKLTKLPGHEGKRIVLLANLRSVKNHILTINAFKNLQHKFPEWTLHFVGNDYDDDYSKEIKKRVGELDLETSIYIHGKKQDISHILSQCEIGVLSSTYEGLPVALLEYGLSKLAVLTTNTGDCSKVIINNENGYLVENNNLERFSIQLEKLVSQKNIRNQFKDAIFETIKSKFSEQKVIEDLIKIYQSII